MRACVCLCVWARVRVCVHACVRVYLAHSYSGTLVDVCIICQLLLNNGQHSPSRCTLCVLYWLLYWLFRVR